MKKQLFLTLVVALGFSLIMTLVPVCEAALPENPDGFVAPATFRPLGQPPARFRARSMRFALRSVNQTMPIT